MGISYKPLLRLLVDRGMTKTDLQKELGFSSATLAKLGKGGSLSGSNIEKLCTYFSCQVQDIVEIIRPDEQQAADVKPGKTSLRKKNSKKSRQ